VVVSSLAPVFALAMFAPGGAPTPKKERSPDAAQSRIVIRTRDDVLIGTDLHYEKGVFRLRDGSSEIPLAEDAVERISFLKSIPEEIASPVVGLALRLAHHRRSGVLKMRGALPEGIFLLPGEPLPETFSKLSPKVRPPEAVAILCIEVAVASLKKRKPEIAFDLLSVAERDAGDKARAFVYGLMRTAFLFEQDRISEGKEALQGLRERYRDHELEIARFSIQLRLTGGMAPPKS